MVKIVETAKRALTAFRNLGVEDVAKRQGLYVCRMLEPQNAQKWADWAARHGIPNALGAADMHVTVLYSPTVDVKVPMLELPIVIDTQGYCGGCFAFFGPKEDVLVFAFRNWELQDRHYQFLDAGAVSTYPSFRPHLTISASAPGFEIPDSALADVPRYIVLGPEVNADPKPGDDATGEDGMSDDDDDMIIVIEVACAAAAKALKDQADSLNPIDATALYDVSKGRVTRGVAKRLATLDWAPAEIKALATAEKKVAKPARKRLQKDMTIMVSEMPEELREKLGPIAKSMIVTDVEKTNEEEQIVLGIASVSTIGGELVTDYHGDEVTTKALVEFNRSLLGGTRAGKFEHSGEVVTEVVAGLVLTNDWQKSLGIDLGFEPYLVEIHVPDPKDWAVVKTGDWELSIAGTLWYYEDEDEADAV